MKSHCKSLVFGLRWFESRRKANYFHAPGLETAESEDERFKVAFNPKTKRNKTKKNE
jgi:hypothetical protein